MDSVFKHILYDNERILWQEKPYFPLFIVNFNDLLAIAVSVLLCSFLLSGMDESTQIILIIFFFIFFVPMIYRYFVYPNTYYALTNRRIIFRSGFMGIDYKSVDYDCILNAECNVNPLENIFGVGTIRVFNGEFCERGPTTNDMRAIPFPYETYKRMKSIAMDIKSDINFPNKLRPEDNPGYHSKYRE